MMGASTNGGGQSMTPGPTDVCKTPAPPAPPVPLPYPNIAQLNQAKGDTCSSKVLIDGKKTATEETEISMSSGDEPGTAGGGVMSNKFKGPCKFKQGSGGVKAEGKKVAYVTCMVGHNGDNANMPAGTQVAPSQTKVTVMP